MRLRARRLFTAHDLRKTGSTFPDHAQRISISFQRVFSLVAWKIEALASASASLADAVALSKSPASADFFAAASVAAVVVH